MYVSEYLVPRRAIVFRVLQRAVDRGELAPDADFAEAWSREQYGRRGESVALWLVPRDAIRDVEHWADEFDLKYRRVDGYSIKARLKEARERAGTAGDR